MCSSRKVFYTPLHISLDLSLPISFCDECYPASYKECEDLTFPVGLTPSTNYISILTNHKGQRYNQNVTSDTGGAITIDISKFPEGFFNPYQGFYTLEVTDTAGTTQTLTIAYSAYECVSFDIYSSNDAN